MSTKEELETEIGRLEEEIGVVKHQIAAEKGLIAKVEKEIAEAKHRRSPEYEAELTGRLLAMDHRDAFKQLAPTLGLLPRAVNHAWNILTTTGRYKIVGQPSPAAIEYALGTMRESHDFMFSNEVTAPPARWSPSGPTVGQNGTLYAHGAT